MAEFWVNLSGTVKVDAANKDEARRVAMKELRESGGAYCWPATPMEIGVDCDEAGWPLQKK